MQPVVGHPWWTKHAVEPHMGNARQTAGFERFDTTTGRPSDDCYSGKAHAGRAELEFLASR